MGCGWCCLLPEATLTDEGCSNHLTEKEVPSGLCCTVESKLEIHTTDAAGEGRGWGGGGPSTPSELASHDKVTGVARPREISLAIFASQFGLSTRRSTPSLT